MFRVWKLSAVPPSQERPGQDRRFTRTDRVKILTGSGLGKESGEGTEGAAGGGEEVGRATRGILSGFRWGTTQGCEGSIRYQNSTPVKGGEAGEWERQEGRGK